MVYILILIIQIHTGTATAISTTATEFNSYESCVVAGEAIAKSKKFLETIRYECFEKGELK